MQPSICIDSKCLPIEILNVAWFLNGLEKPVQSCLFALKSPFISPFRESQVNIPLMPMVDTVRGTGGSSYSSNK